MNRDFFIGLPSGVKSCQKSPVHAVYRLGKLTGRLGRHTRRLIDSTLQSNGRLLSIQAETAREKMWSAERFGRAIGAFLKERNEYCVVVLGQSRAEVTMHLGAARVLSMIGAPLDVSMGLVAASRLFVGVDSVMLHAADLFRVPSVGIFGTRSHREFGFCFGPHQYVLGNGPTKLIPEKKVLQAMFNMADYSRDIL